MTDGGTIWSEPTILFEPDDQWTYMYAAKEGTDTIHFAINPFDQPVGSIYYLRYTGGEFYLADGTSIGTKADLPFTASDIDLVYDHTTESAIEGA